jgi:hypothetical protein
MRHIQAAAAMTFISCVLLAPAFAEKPDEIAAKQAALSEDADTGDVKAVQRRLGDLVDPVRIENASAKDAFKWWAKTTGVSLVIDWRQMEEDGIDPEKRIDVDLHNVPAGKLLGLLMKQTSPDVQLLYEVTPWYIQITTKARAAKTLVTRFYDVSDLVHEPTPVRAVPKLDLASALNAGKDGGASVLGGNAGDSQRAKTDGSQQLIDAITTTIEPDLWENRGGPCSISFFRGFLVVKAPVFVQVQIGLPTQTNSPRPIIGTAGGPDKVADEKPTDRPGHGVAGISSTPSKVGGIAK